MLKNTWIFVIVFCVIGYVLYSFPQNNTKAVSSNSIKAIYSSGKVVTIIGNEKFNDILIGSNKEGWHRSSSAFSVDKGTRARVLEVDAFYNVVKVAIIDGKWFGEIGWVEFENVDFD